MSGFSVTILSRKPRKHNNVRLRNAQITLDQISDVTLDLSILFFDDRIFALQNLLNCFEKTIIFLTCTCFEFFYSNLHCFYFKEIDIKIANPRSRMIC